MVAAGWRWLVVASLVVGCGGGSGDDDASTSADDASAAPQARGPRALPPTFVSLEVASFPRPADESCADNTNIVDVAAGQSIADAIASAPSGSTVRVAAGTYTERPSEATALGWTTPNLCVRAAVPGTVVVQAGSQQAYGVSINAADAVLEGVTLRGFANGVGFDSGASNVTVEGVRVEQMSGGFRNGIVAFGAFNGLLVLDSVVESADLGISCNTGPCSHWWIEGTTVVGRATGSGNSGADAFAIENGRQIAVVSSTLSVATGDGIDTKADDVVVYGARVLNVERNGVKLWRGGDVINTIISGTGADASLIGDAPGRYRYLHVVIANHDPGGTGYVGTWGYDAQTAGFQLEIVNSVIANSSSGGLFVPASASVSMRRTLLDTSSGKLLDLGPSQTFLRSELAAFESAGHGSGNLVGDPMFANPGSGDFSTAASSPTRDAAEIIADLAGDIDGNPRTRGDGPDIGAVESE